MSTWQDRIERAVAPALIEKVPRDHEQPDSEFRRRRIVVAIVLVGGATLLGFSLAVKPGNSLFYLLTMLVAATWIGGGLLSGPVHLGYIPFRGALRRPIITPIVIGLMVSAIFLAGGSIIREIPPLRDYVVNLLEHAQKGSLTLVAIVAVVNGAAEEVFFRGAVFAAIGRNRPVVISTIIYGLATVATRNPMLVFSALTLGLVLALQRRASGGILGSMLTHVTWSMVMLFVLPPLLHA